MAKLVVFPLTLVLLLGSLSYMLRPDNNNGKTRFMGFYSLPKNSLEVVVVGSSCVYRGWCAPYAYGKYGLVSYPLSSVAQFAVLIKYMIIEAMKYQDPKLFVVDLRQFRYDVDNDILSRDDSEALLRSAVDNMRYSANRIDAIKSVGDIMMTDKSFTQTNENDIIFDITKYKSNWLHIDPGAWRFSKDDPLRGYVFTTTTKNQHIDPQTGQITKSVPLSPSTHKAFIDLLDFCKARNLQVLFTDTPYKITTNYQMLNNEMKAIIESYHYSGFKVFDGNAHYSQIGLDSATDFRDNLHLNLRGSLKYTSYLANYIMTTYHLKDLRGDPAYKGWDASYQTWLKEEKTAAQAMGTLPGGMKSIA